MKLYTYFSITEFILSILYIAYNNSHEMWMYWLFVGSLINFCIMLLILAAKDLNDLYEIKKEIEITEDIDFIDSVS